MRGKDPEEGDWVCLQAQVALRTVVLRGAICIVFTFLRELDYNC
jgi:hypothetical protein